MYKICCIFYMKITFFRGDAYESYSFRNRTFLVYRDNVRLGNSRFAFGKEICQRREIKDDIYEGFGIYLTCRYRYQ